MNLQRVAGSVAADVGLSLTPIGKWFRMLNWKSAFMNEEWNYNGFTLPVSRWTHTSRLSWYQLTKILRQKSVANYGIYFFSNNRGSCESRIM